MLNKECTEPYRVRCIEAIYFYTRIKIILQFFECKSLKEFSSPEQYQYAEGFQRLHTDVKLRCATCLSFQILSFKYLPYDI